MPIHATLVHVSVVPGSTAAFIAASLANQAATRREPGNLRFDIVQDKEDPSRFLLYEVFQDAEAAAAHKQTEHYLAWRDAVAPLMAQPRSGQPLVFHGGP